MASTVRVGQIVAAFGIQGQVKVLPLTDFLERFEAGRRVRVNDEWRTIDKAAEHKGQLVLTLSGIKDRTAAEDLQWAYLEALVEERPELEPDEYLSSDLVGLRAETWDGKPLGVVQAVERYPAHDVLLVDGVRVPAVAEFVDEVDLEGKKIVLKPIPGMFEEVEA